MSEFVVGDVVEWVTGRDHTREAGLVIESDSVGIRTRCLRRRIRGSGGGEWYECEFGWARDEFDRLRKVGLPTPSLTASVTTPPGNSKWDTVVVAGYAPPKPAELDHEDPRAHGHQQPRRRGVCKRCGVEGHNANNRKHHPRQL